MDTSLISIALFILWTIFGSFWWVLIGREWTKEWIKSIFFGRSKCDKCGKTLSAIELIPILSFCIQKWKCKSCHTKLSYIYPILEVVMWLIFVCTYLFFPYTSIWELIFWIFINRWLSLIFIFDIQKYELHQPIWLLITIVSLCYSLFKFQILDIITVCLPLILIFISIYFFWMRYVKIRFHEKWEWFWLWDVYLATTVSFLAIWIFQYNHIFINILNSFSLTLIYIVLSCVVWLLYVIFERLISNRKDIKIPFLPSMIIAFWILIFTWNVFINLF